MLGTTWIRLEAMSTRRSTGTGVGLGDGLAVGEYVGDAVGEAVGELLLWVKLLGWHWLLGSEKEWALE